MERKEIILGLACIAGLALIIAHSLLFGAATLVQPPWVLEKNYFENPEKYAGMPIRIFEIAESVSGNSVGFVNALDEKVSVEVDDAGGIESGTPMILEVVYDSGAGKINGRVLYLPKHSEERVEVSAVAFVWVVLCYFVWKKKLYIDWRKVKVVIGDSEGQQSENKAGGVM